MKTKKLSYLGNERLKRDLLDQIEVHRKNYQIIQGSYGEQNGIWKGCSVACALRSVAIIKNLPLEERYGDHQSAEDLLGWPEWLMLLNDKIFENLPLDEALFWPGRLAAAIPVGVNLTPVRWKFCAVLLKENIERMLSLKIDEVLKELVVKSIRGVLAVHESALETGIWDERAAVSGRSAAESAVSAASSAMSAAASAVSAASSAMSAAASAAESAAASAAENSAWSAMNAAENSAWSAVNAAESAAWSAAENSAWSAAWNDACIAAYKNYAKNLIKILKSHK